mmetsp:Transcript_2295/g.3946  ORF Transcript_2295/g.3946 Transcript_2295/m.3946 type:complete len:371 (+) Transcript_2295:64-1176(+)
MRPLSQGDAPVVVPAAGVQAASSGSSAGPRRNERRRQTAGEWVCTLWRTHVTPYALQVQYTCQFKVFVLLVFAVAVAWVLHYLLVVLPAVQEHRDQPCRFNDHQLTYDARMLFLYFLWFTCARGSLFIPCIAVSIANIQTRSHGFCRTYLVHLVLRDGPLYIFLIASLLFLVQLMQSHDCPRSRALFSALNMYAIYSCVLSMLCFILSMWHNKVLNQIAPPVGPPAEDRGAPAETITSLESMAYDAALFGDEDDKPYPAECAICLLPWEPQDAIKVTPCMHAFHEECLGNWLRSARTCPVCRLDLTKPHARDGNVGSSSPTGLVPGGRPAPARPAVQTIGNQTPGLYQSNAPPMAAGGGAQASRNDMEGP